MTDPTQEIKELIHKYTEAVYSQDKDKFYSIWANNSNCILISIANEFTGIESIYNDFIINIIQKSYSVIKLIPDDVQIRLINENVATVVFAYHTECILRKNGEKFGIKGLETQLIIKENGKWKIQHIHYSKSDKKTIFYFL